MPQTRQLGREHLISQLHAGGVRVAERGNDLVVSVDDGSGSGCPIQLHSSEDSRFRVMRHYEQTSKNLLVYAWNVSSDAPELYALTYGEAFKIVNDKGHTATKSWNDLGGWSVRATSTWRQMLSPHRMQPQDWAPKISSLSNTSPMMFAVKE